MKIASQHKRKTSDAKIVFSENGRKVVFDNCGRRTFIKIEIDGEVFQKGTPGRRCDFVLTDDDETNERYVELKGKDVKHALEQIEQTIKDFGEDERCRKSYVVCTKNTVPGFDTLRQRFRKRCKTELVVRTGEYTETI